MINIRVLDALNFTAVAPCGRAWLGYRHSNDVRIVLDDAMDHAQMCADCAKKSTATIERDQ